MKYTFIPMNRKYATRMVENWKYAGEYSIYNYENETDHILDEQGWASGIFAVLDQKGELIGELSVDFYNEQEEPLDYSDYGNEELRNQCKLWIGFGLRPDLVGQGRGAEFVTACCDFAVQHFEYRGKSIGLGVAWFNQRAIKAYEKAGFEIFQKTIGDIAGRELECVYMRKNLP